jgi:hypothetical protein
MATPTPTMRTGAVLMMDALGFKGISERKPLKSIMEKLWLLREHKDRLQPLAALAATAGADLQVEFLSDTVVVACFDPTDPPLTVALATTVGGYLTMAAVADTDQGRKYDVQLAHRGVVTFGEFYIDGSFLVGGAVDVASEHYERADGAFIWLHESALVHRDRVLKVSALRRPIATEWDVSLDKGETHMKTLVASPLGHTKDPVDTSKAILDTFESGKAKPRVAWYQENTRKFLDVALAEQMDWLRKNPGGSFE